MNLSLENNVLSANLNDILYTGILMDLKIIEEF